MTDAEEQAYIEGQRSVYRTILRDALVNLGRDGAEWNETRWLLEREEAISMLRRVCRDHGDNDWPDDLHLADIIEKHLARHLEL